MIRPAALAALALAALLQCRKPTIPTAEAAVGEIRITDAFAYAPITEESGAAYLTLRNTGAEPDTLAAVSSPIAAAAGVHGSMTAGGGSMMTRIADLPIPPGGQVTLKPGGAHLMLERLSRLPKPGDSIPLTLNFRRAGAVTIELPVRPYGQ